MSLEEQYRQETVKEVIEFLPFTTWLKDQIAAEVRLREAAELRLHEITEEYINMEAFVPQTAPEAYLLTILKRIYDITK